MNEQPTIAFFGTPQLCIPILEQMKSAGLTPSVIVTNPDRPVGRKQIITPPPVKVWAKEHGIPALQPEKLDDEFYANLKTKNLELSVVVAYGKIIPENVIELPKHGTLNVHYSLLPKYRGATPTEAAILAGDTTTGVTIQKMVYKLDAGPILAQQTHNIAPDIKTPELRNELNEIGAKLLAETIPAWLNGEVEPRQQDEEQVTTCGLIKKSDGEVDLQKMSDQELWNRYRAYYGWPGIFYFDENGKRVKVTEATFQDGPFDQAQGKKFIIKKIIPEGKSEMTVA